MFVAVVLSRIAEAYVDPRASARAIINARPSLGDQLTMVLAASALSLVFQLSIIALLSDAGGDQTALSDGPPSASDEEPTAGPPSAFDRAIFGFGVGLIEYFLLSSLAFFVGKQAGGTGERQDLGAVIAWLMLATVPLSAFAQLAVVGSVDQGGINPLAQVFFIVAQLYFLYLIGAFIAEAHGFKNVASVVAGALGVMIVLALFTLMVAQMMGIGIQA